MNYDEAREISGGGWHWTSMNDGVVRTAQPCIGPKGDIPADYLIGVTKEPIEWERCSPHATKEEAERHFYDWCLSRLVETECESAERCEQGCGEWTNKTLENRGLSGLFKSVFLCDEHRSKEVVATLHPFRPGIQIIHS